LPFGLELERRHCGGTLFRVNDDVDPREKLWSGAVGDPFAMLILPRIPFSAVYQCPNLVRGSGGDSHKILPELHPVPRARSATIVRATKREIERVK
jgi:hypothetical protein